MRYLSASFALVLVLALGAISSAQAQDKREANMIRSMGLSPTAQVTYLDETGNPLDFENLFKLVVGGRSVSVSKDTKADSAVVSVDPLGRAAEPLKLGLKVSAGEALPRLRLKSSQGSYVTNETLKGRYTLINFLYSECGPCIAEIPVLNAFAAAHPEFATIAVTFDTAQEAKRFSSKRKLDWPLLAEAQDFIDAIGVTVYPMMALVGPDGRIIGLSTSSQIAGAMKPLTGDDLLAWVNGLKSGKPAK